ncbi:hypothetical protein [Hymenobacter sp. IS2118]|uniref:hypothetical protein n=1 Tax=Hymenobacter sp. IS2118 TaxID=1505605 RepID=UPI0005544F77|nr:hypothetical protein [Hymenobacter sp. IS2118]
MTRFFAAVTFAPLLNTAGRIKWGVQAARNLGPMVEITGPDFNSLLPWYIQFALEMEDQVRRR